MAAPAHYIRTIHTSFTAAHPHPSWSSPSSSSASSHSNVLLNSNTTPFHAQNFSAHLTAHILPSHSQKLNHTNSNAAQIQSLGRTHGLPPSSGAGGRRRAYAFRSPAPFSSSASASASPSQVHAHHHHPITTQAPTPAPRRSAYKFDPFADLDAEPSVLPALSAPRGPQLHIGAGGGAHSLHGRNGGAGHHHHHHHQQQRTTFYSTPPSPPAVGTAPVRAPTPAPTPNKNLVSQHVARGGSYTTYAPSTSTEVVRSGGGASVQQQQQRGRTSPPQVHRQQQEQGVVIRLRSPSPPTSTAPAASTTATSSSSPTPTSTSPRFIYDKDAKARLVAGILLNRAHLGGQRGRRRVGGGMMGGGGRVYAKSGLSSVVAVGCEA